MMMAGMKKREMQTRVIQSLQCQGSGKAIQHWRPYSGLFSGTARWYRKMMGMEKAMDRIQALATNHFALLPDDEKDNLKYGMKREMLK